MSDFSALRVRLPAPIRVALISLLLSLLTTLPVLLFVYNQTDALFEQRIRDRLDDEQRAIITDYSNDRADQVSGQIDQAIRTGELEMELR